MSRLDPFEPLRERGFQFEFLSHARAILFSDFSDALSELVAVLGEVTVPIQEIVASGGGEAKGTQRLRGALFDKGWRKGRFTIIKEINKIPKESVTHEIDHVRATGNGTLALEIEWNNKDPFFDRDLENFKRLHAEGAISVGILITRGSSLQSELRALVRKFAELRSVTSFSDLEKFGVEPTRRQKAAIEKRIGRTRQPASFQDAWTDHFVGDKFGAASTHWSKLADRISRGVSNPCPLLAIGLPATIVTFDEPDALARDAPDDD